MRQYIYIIIALTLLLSYSTKANDHHVIDSLNQAFQSAKHDTDKINCLLVLGEELIRPNPDTVLIIQKEVEQIAEREITKTHAPVLHKKYLHSLAEALNNIGYIYKNQGDILLALEYYHKSLKIREDIGHKGGIANSLNNIGRIYQSQGDIPKALEYAYKSLKIREDIGEKEGIAASFNNIGYTYHIQGDISLALEYYHKSLKIEEELGSKGGVATSLNNIGAIYNKQGDIPKALEYFHKSLKISEEIGDKEGVANSLNNIGSIYNGQGDISLGLKYVYKSLKIREDLGDKRGLSVCLNNIGQIEFDRGALTIALNYGMRGLEIAQKIGSPYLISRNSYLLSRVTKKQGNYQEALVMYELHIQMRDSIKNEETQKATIRQQTKYEFEKAQLVKEQEEKEAARIVAEETNRRDNLQYSVILIAILTLFGGVLALGFINVSERMAEGIIFFSFLILFEFLLVLADPYIDGWSGGAPGIKLLFNAGIAALIFPAHAFFESKLKGRLVKK